MSNTSEYNSRYYAEHKEEISERRKKVYKRDKKKITERNLKWRNNNREHWNAYMREYRRKKKENVVIICFKGMLQMVFLNYMCK